MSHTAIPNNTQTQTQMSLKSQLYQYTKNKIFHSSQYSKSIKSPTNKIPDNINTTPLEKSMTSSLLKIKTETKPIKVDNNNSTKNQRPTTPGSNKTPKGWPSTLLSHKNRSSLRETKTNLSSISVTREAFIERKLAEKRRLELSSIKLDSSVQEDGAISIDLCLSNRERSDENESKGKNNKNKNEDSILLGRRKVEVAKDKVKPLTGQKSPTEKSAQRIKEKVSSPAMTKNASKKELVTSTKNKVLSPSKSTAVVPPLFKTSDNKDLKEQKDSVVSPLGPRRRSKSVLLTKKKEGKFQGFYIETDLMVNSDIQDFDNRDTPRLPQSTNDMENNTKDGDIKKEESNKESDIIRKLQEEISSLKNRLQVAEQNTTIQRDEDLIEMTPKNNQGAFAFTLNNLTTQHDVDMKQKEIDMQKMQIDALKMTVDFLNRENELLKDSQKKMFQYKEAAKRYRELAKIKTEECLSLAEEVVRLRRSPNRRNTEKLSTFNPDNSPSQRKSTFVSKQIESLFFNMGGKLIHEKALLKSVSSISTGSIIDIVAEAQNEQNDTEALRKTPSPEENMMNPLDEETIYLEDESLSKKESNN